jgi:hypothetical protein
VSKKQREIHIYGLAWFLLRLSWEDPSPDTESSSCSKTVKKLYVRSELLDLECVLVTLKGPRLLAAQSHMDIGDQDRHSMNGGFRSWLKVELLHSLQMDLNHAPVSRGSVTPLIS